MPHSATGSRLVLFAYKMFYLNLKKNEKKKQQHLKKKWIPPFDKSGNGLMGAQWLSGRVLDSRLRGHGFEPHWRHCVAVLEQDAFILA